MPVNKSFRIFLLILGMVIVSWCVQLPEAQAHKSFVSAITNSGLLIGRPFNISVDSIDETSSSVAYNSVDGEYLVLWHNVRPSAPDDIYAQRISEQGELLSGFYVADGLDPRVAYNPKNNTYLVVYSKWVSSDYDVYAQRVDHTGPLGSEILVAFNLNQNEAHPVVAYNTHPNYDEFLVAWENTLTTPFSITQVEGIRIAGTAGGGDGGGDTIGNRLGIAADGNYYLNPDLTYNLNMNEYLVVFTRQPGSGGEYDIYARRVTGDGVVLGSVLSIDSSGGNQSKPAVAAYRLNPDNPYLVVFNDYWNDTAGDVRGYLVNKEGQPTTLINIATTPNQREFDPAIAQNEEWSGYFVSWTQGPLLDTDIFGRQVTNIGITKSSNNLSGYPGGPSGCERDASDIAVGQLSALVVWTDPCGSAGGLDILGRMLGYRIHLPLVIR